MEILLIKKENHLPAMIARYAVSLVMRERSIVHHTGVLWKQVMTEKKTDTYFVFNITCLMPMPM